MRLSAIIALSISALLMGGYLLFCGQQAPQGSSRRILQGLQPDRIDRIVLGRGKQIIADLSRASDGTWEMVKPRAGLADAEAVAGILFGAEFLEPVRSLPSSNNPRQLGLAPPQLRLEMSQGASSIRLGLGRMDPSGHGVYLAHNGEVYVVGRSFWDVLDREPDDFRDRDLARISHEALKGMELAGSWALRKSSGGWQVRTDDVWVRADLAGVDRIVGALVGLRAARFIGDDPRDLPPTIVSIEERQRLQLRFGSPCPGRSTEQLLARRIGNEPWVWSCVDTEDLRPLSGVSTGDLQDLALTPLREFELARVRIAHGRQTLQLRRESGLWRINDSVDGDQQRVRQWIDGLRSFRGRLDTAPGTTKFISQIELEGESGSRQVLRVGSPTKEGYPVQRDRERAVLWVPGELGPFLITDALHFRSRRVLEVPAHDVIRVATSRGGEEEVVVRRKGKWELIQPVQLPADQQQIQQLLERLSRLDAEEFTTRDPGGEAVTISLHIRIEDLVAADAGAGEDKTRSIRVDQACRARINGIAPFVLDRDTCSLLRGRRAVRSLFKPTAQPLSRIKIDVSGRRALALEKRGPTWHGPSGTVDPSRISELLLGIQKLSASEVLAYTKTLSRPPRLRIELIDATGRSQTCVVDPQGRAVVEDRPVLYRILVGEMDRIVRLIDAMR